MTNNGFKVASKEEVDALVKTAGEPTVAAAIGEHPELVGGDFLRPETIKGKLVKRPRGRPPKHGAYSKFALNTLTEAKVEEIRSIMDGEKLAVAPSDRLYINTLGRLLAQMELIDRWLAQYGYFEDEGRGLPRPIVQHYLNLAKQVGKMLEAMGMTPTARYRLGREALQSEDIASKLMNARQS
jgi:hypothetical protein